MLNMPFWATSLISRSRLGAIGDPYSASATTSAKTGLPSRTQRVSFRDGRKASAATKRRRSRQDRKSVGGGKSGEVRVDTGGRRIIKKKNKQQIPENTNTI